MASEKKLGLWSAISTIAILFLFACIAFFAALLALNGVSESKGTWVLGIWLSCHILIMIAAGWGSAQAARWMHGRLGWSAPFAAISSIFCVSMLGSVASFVSFLIALLAMGIK